MRRLLLCGGVLAATLLTTALPAQAAAPVVLGAGHVDVVDVSYEDGALEIGVHDETVEPDVERDPDDVVLLVKKAARTTVPSGSGWSFLGTTGAPVWILPEIQNEELLWPGLSAEEMEPGDAVTLKVEKVIGPGRLALFTEDATGTPQVLVNSGDGLPDALALTGGEHRHASWAFQKAGVYLIKVRAAATLAASGDTVVSEPAVYKVVVQP
ncbi:choice-of-anchor M domain-containing protein [Actinoplanes sp. NPDC051861]|uniref:choice-of-anchor M domain-containing protein n=1 Tax=Actinoplanes sp. NPDC051861 TaxID=3155170 RepID=UPI0034306E40